MLRCILWYLLELCDLFFLNKNSVLLISIKKNFEQKTYFCPLKMRFFFKKGNSIFYIELGYRLPKSLSLLHVKNSIFSLSYFLKKDEWPEANTDPRLLTLPYTIAPFPFSKNEWKDKDWFMVLENSFFNNNYLRFWVANNAPYLYSRNIFKMRVFSNPVWDSLYAVPVSVFCIYFNFSNICGVVSPLCILRIQAKVKKEYLNGADWKMNHDFW